MPLVSLGQSQHGCRADRHGLTGFQTTPTQTQLGGTLYYSVGDSATRYYQPFGRIPGRLPRARCSVRLRRVALVRYDPAGVFDPRVSLQSEGFRPPGLTLAGVAEPVSRTGDPKFRAADIEYCRTATKRSEVPIQTFGAPREPLLRTTRRQAGTQLNRWTCTNPPGPARTA